MTLDEYKMQTKEITEAIKNFNGKQDELDKLSAEFEKKYPELSEFNKKAMDCNSINDFTEVADLFGIKFSSNESKKVLFEQLKEATKVNKSVVNGELDEDALESVTGGMSKNTKKALAGFGLGMIFPVWLAYEAGAAIAGKEGLVDKIDKIK